MPPDHRKSIILKLKRLSPAQMAYVDNLLSGLTREVESFRAPTSTIVTARFLEEFGIELRGHHGLSERPMTKSQFEDAIDRVFRRCGARSELACQGNPGHDITVENVRYSLKTQANRSIRADFVWISKFMELGKGDWTDKDEQLRGLLKQFLRHMNSYERILVLRATCINRRSNKWKYELIEIPKTLLQEAATGKLEMMHASLQMPKPGYCTVNDAKGTKFQLYFDGGTERKLQVKKLRKDQCIIHATWEF